MAIDHTLRAMGVGASQVAGVLGLDPRTDSFAIYAEKVGLVPRVDNPTDRMLAGKRFEEPIARWYSEKAGVPVQWWDRTLAHPSRSWQVFSADAWVLRDGGVPVRDYGDIAAHAVGGEDSKLVSWDQSDEWGEDGSDVIPERIALQAQYSCSAANLPYWDIAAAMSMSELRIYRIHRDAEIEAIILEAVERFWFDHVLARIPPRPGGSPATTDILRRRYPKHVQPLRCATESEWPLIAALKAAKQEAARANRILAECKSQIQYAIGDAEGLLAGAEKITWRKEKDSVGPDWRAVANELGLRLELLKPIVEHVMLEANLAEEKGLVLAGGATTAVAVKAVDWWSQTMPELAKAHEIIVRHGARKLLTPRSWNSEDDE